METLRNYLESMFANLPNTQEVLRAKSELWQMMEDKYNELVQEGMDEQKAVGTVISDFGNLDELADSLGIENVMHTKRLYQGRVLREEEVEKYLEASTRSSFLNGLGVALCICCPMTFILAEAAVNSDFTDSRFATGFSVLAFFAMLAAAICIFVFNNVRMASWKYLKREHVCIDYATAEYLHKMREEERTKQALLKTIGVLLCVICFVPTAVMGAFDLSERFMMVGAALLFLLVGCGVWILILAGGREEACRMLLRFNDPRTVSGNYVPSQKEVSYTNKTVEQIMSVYTPAVLCIYLIWSFLSFDWHITWILWPIAAVVKHMIHTIWGNKKGETT